jgi:hypothetical protein
VDDLYEYLCLSSQINKSGDVELQAMAQLVLGKAEIEIALDGKDPSKMGALRLTLSIGA